MKSINTYFTNKNTKSITWAIGIPIQKTDMRSRSDQKMAKRKGGGRTSEMTEGWLFGDSLSKVQRGGKLSLTFGEKKIWIKGKELRVRIFPWQNRQEENTNEIHSHFMLSMVDYKNAYNYSPLCIHFLAMWHCSSSPQDMGSVSLLLESGLSTWLALAKRTLTEETQAEARKWLPLWGSSPLLHLEPWDHPVDEPEPTCWRGRRTLGPSGQWPANHKTSEGDHCWSSGAP